MFSKSITSLALAGLLSFASFAFAAVEVNTADASQLETVRGIGPAMSAKILTARKNGAFKDWEDLRTRVPGIGTKKASSVSQAGLTVAGRPKGDAVATDGVKVDKSARSGKRSDAQIARK